MYPDQDELSVQTVYNSYPYTTKVAASKERIEAPQLTCPQNEKDVINLLSGAFVSVHCCLVATCWERADLLVLVGDA